MNVVINNFVFAFWKVYVQGSIWIKRMV